jgi:hypothetical protein
LITGTGLYVRDLQLYGVLKELLTQVPNSLIQHCHCLQSIEERKSQVRWWSNASNSHIELRAPDVLVKALGDVPALCQVTLHDTTTTGVTGCG